MRKIKHRNLKGYRLKVGDKVMIDFSNSLKESEERWLLDREGLEENSDSVFTVVKVLRNGSVVVMANTKRHFLAISDLKGVTGGCYEKE